MRRPGTLSTILAAAFTATAAAPVLAQPAPDRAPAAQGANVSALGRKMPPATGRAPAPDAGTAGAKAADARAESKASTEAEMVKAQRAAEARNKAWDSKMRKTMGSICSGC